MNEQKPYKYQRKKFLIDNCDSLTVKRLKLLYLIPFIIIVYPISVVIAGISEIGNPFSGVWGIITRGCEDE